MNKTTIPIVPKEEAMSIEETDREREEAQRRITKDMYGWNIYERPVPVVPKDECCKKVCHSLNEHISMLEKEYDRLSEERTYRYINRKPVYPIDRKLLQVGSSIGAFDDYREHIEKINFCKCARPPTEEERSARRNAVRPIY